MSAMTDKVTYNGWKNYPTWAVHLWLTNDEGLYRASLDVVESYRMNVESYRMNAGLTGSERAHVADGLREWVCGELAPDLGATFAADLLGYALDSVDWFEIADSFLEDVNED